MTIRRLSIALILALVGFARGDELRLALPPAFGTTDAIAKADDAVRLHLVLALYLHDRLGQLPGVRLVTPEWSGDVLAEVAGGKRLPAPGGPLAPFRAFLPVDALIDWELVDGEFVCRVYRGAATHERRLPCPPGTAVLQLLPPIAELLAEALDLPAAKALGDPGYASSAPFEAAWFSRRLGAVWIYNSGETRLTMLRPHLEQLPGHPSLVQSFLEAGILLSTDKRKVQHPGTNLEMVRLALPLALGTPLEADACRFLAANRHQADAFVEQLMEWAGPLGQDSMDALLDEPADAGDALPGAGVPTGGLAAIVQAKRTHAQQRGALRCLGFLQADKALPLILRCAGSETAPVREAAAAALGQFAPNEPIQAALRKLAGDAEGAVAFTAAYSLWQQGEPPANLLATARRVLADDPTLRPLDVIADLGTPEDVDRLRGQLASDEPARRQRAVAGLCRLEALDGEALLTVLGDVDAGVVRAALADLPATLAPTIAEALTTLANQPYAPVAEAARMGLAPHRPADEAAAIAFELRGEHPYIRQQHVDTLAATDAPWALDLLTEATANADSHLRAYALGKLADRAPERAADQLARLTADPYRWVRLHAAAVAARVARPADAELLRQALGAEPDEATQLWLRDAVARAEGKPVPPSDRAPVHDVSATRNQPLLCGYSGEVKTSPIPYYYCLNTAMEPPAREAYDQGKIFIGRANHTVGNPGLIVTDLMARDRFWIGLQTDVEPLPWLDGLVIGEESMYIRPWQLWESGWRLFCHDAKLDPATIAGDREKLTANQQAAWLHWEKTTGIRGFNQLYDYIKLRYGKLRPGFLVATYMTDQDGPNPADLDWKFDIAAGYNYGTSTRNTYTTIRRFKTLWPDRPVQWLSLGNGAAGVKNVKYALPVPDTLVHPRGDKAYADSVAAWLAGADTGWFSIWLFTQKDVDEMYSSGVWVHLEDAGPDSATLAKGIENVFKGIEEFYRFQAKGEPKAGGLDDAGGEGLGDFALEEYSREKDPIVKRVEAEKARFSRGFQLLQKRVYDVARAMDGMPLPLRNEPVLLIGNPRGVNAFLLPNAYDYLADINKLPGIDPAVRYRTIIVADNGKTPLRDDTIRTLAAWLRETPGCLVVSGWLATDNALEAATAADHDGQLAEDWPWEAEVTWDGKLYKGATGETDLALWRPSGFKGAVVFDAINRPAADLAPHLAKLAAEGIGVAFDGPANVERGVVGPVTGIVSGNQPGLEVTGIDLYSGVPSPTFGKGRDAVLIAQNYAGTYVACYNGVAILCDQPIVDVVPVDGGLRVICPGLIRASALSGSVAIATADGKPLPTVAPEQGIAWALSGTTPGVLTVPIPDSTAVLTFLRAEGPVTILHPGRDASK